MTLVEPASSPRTATHVGPAAAQSKPVVEGTKKSGEQIALYAFVIVPFLAVLAVGAVGHALSIAVRRRRHELAVLRALGLTRRQSRLVIGTQATLLAIVGLAFGIPLGIALGRILWHAAANTTPLAYNPPWALLALLLIAPVALVAANLLASWPARRAARLRTAQILRTE
jgi:ABC-type antimicrobial peptide transport system permease subunit